jgi:hypothetical protein
MSHNHPRKIATELWWHMAVLQSNFENSNKDVLGCERCGNSNAVAIVEQIPSR